MATLVAFRSSHKDTHDLGTSMIDHGWTYLGINGSGHHQFRWKDGTVYPIACTPSDSRSVLNARSAMRRIMGWTNPPKPSTPRSPKTQRVALDATKHQRLQLVTAVHETRDELVQAALLAGDDRVASMFRLFAHRVEQRLRQ